MKKNVTLARTEVVEAEAKQNLIEKVMIFSPIPVRRLGKCGDESHYFYNVDSSKFIERSSPPEFSSNWCDAGIF